MYCEFIIVSEKNIHNLFQVKAVFGTRGRKVEIFVDHNLKKPLAACTDVTSLSSTTLYVMPKAEKPTACNITSPVCHFANVEVKKASGKPIKGTVLLENPRGSNCMVEQILTQVYSLDFYILLQ